MAAAARGSCGDDMIMIAAVAIPVGGGNRTMRLAHTAWVSNDSVDIVQRVFHSIDGRRCCSGQLLRVLSEIKVIEAVAATKSS